jgi:hypothetical protein
MFNVLAVSCGRFIPIPKPNSFSSMKQTLLLLAAFTLFIVSCGKDDTQPETNAITGNYDFVGLTASGTTETTIDNIRSIATYGYYGLQPKGTTVIDAQKVANKDWTYSVDTIVHGETYVDGQLMGISNQPMVMDVPSSSSTATYKLIGTDSIYFDNGFVSGVGAGGADVPATPAGYKISWSGDTLIMRTRIDMTYNQTVQGETYNVHAISSVELKMKKKSN